MEQLKVETNQGDFVHRTQKIAAEKDFKNVSEIWVNKCMTIEDGIAKLKEGYAETEDKNYSLRSLIIDSEENQVRVVDADGNALVPTEHALSQLCGLAKCGAHNILSLWRRDDRDEEDAATIVKVLRNGLRRLDQDKRLFLRSRKDGTLRAVLSDSYSPINNEWFLEIIKTIIPGGLLSHWKGNSDTIYSNVLIPDSIRTEEDSDYGGMLSIGNSEIGERRLETRPSVFRAICMNGCIWDKKSGFALTQVHRGKIDLDILGKAIHENLTKQIAIMDNGIEKLLESKTMIWAKSSPLPLFAQMAIDYELSKQEMTQVLKGFLVEKQETPQHSKSLFGLVNSLTRASQTMDAESWIRLDSLAGQMICMNNTQWETFVNNAKKLSVEQVQERFESLSL